MELNQMDLYLNKEKPDFKDIRKEWILLLFGSVTSLSRLTKVLNLSPRKLSGVLREADVDNGLELFALVMVG
jgi:hypothetical protein